MNKIFKWEKLSKAAFFVSLIFLSSVISADTITLKSGKKVEGEVLAENDVFVRIKEYKEGQLSEFLREDIESVVKGAQPQNSRPQLEQPVNAVNNQEASSSVTNTIKEQPETIIPPKEEMIEKKQPQATSLPVITSAVQQTKQAQEAAPAQKSSEVITLVGEPHKEKSKKKSRLDLVKKFTIKQWAIIGGGMGILLLVIILAISQKKETLVYSEQKVEVIEKNIETKPKKAGPQIHSYNVSKSVETAAPSPGQTAQLPSNVQNSTGNSVPKSPVVHSYGAPKPTEGSTAPVVKADAKIPAQGPAVAKEKKNKEPSITEKNYWQKIWEIFVYPLRGGILPATLGGAIFFSFIQIILLSPFIGIVIAVMMVCYQIGCLCKIMQTAVEEEDVNRFEWPEFLNMFEWVGTAILFALTFVITYLPIYLYVRYLGDFSSFSHHSLSAMTVGGHFSPEIFGRAVVSVFPTKWHWFGLFFLLLMACYIQPMFTMSIALVGGVGSLNIINVFKSIGATFVDYTLTFILMILIGMFSIAVHMIPIYKIPFLGIFFRMFVTVYFWFVNMRLLGLFYKAHRNRLGWYGELG